VLSGAGSFRKVQVHPDGCELLKRMNLPAEGFPQQELGMNSRRREGPAHRFYLYRVPTTPPASLSRLRESRLTAHWGIADPAAVEGNWC